jgi:ribosomal RNA-processing protein 17
LTGFHKRKVQRKEQAIERAKDLEKKQRIEERNRIRQERKEQIAKDLKRFHDAMNEINNGDSEKEDQEIYRKEQPEDNDSPNYSDWEGFDEDNDQPKNGILKRMTQNYGDAIVTIEELDFESALNSSVDLSRSEEVLKESISKAQLSARILQQQQKQTLKIRKPKLKRKKR